MERHECDTFATIRHVIDLTHAEPVRLMMDVGANRWTAHQ